MILHAAAHWKHDIDSSMWPMAVKYTAHVYNSLPRANNISPSDLFYGTRVPGHKLQNMHVWGCPVYVLNPSLQSEKKFQDGILDPNVVFFVILVQCIPQKFHKY